MKTLASILLLAAGCTTGAVDDGAFHVSGRVLGPATHVIASAAGADRVVAEIARDGRFDVALAPQHAWALAFADASQHGAAMLAGTWQNGTLDTLPAQQDGAIDLGDVRFADGYARGTVARADLLDALGIDEDTAARIGAVDDLATRLAAPDVNGNGVLDALEPGADYRLDLSGDIHRMKGDRDFDLNDLLRGADATGIEYSGTAISVGLPATFRASTMATAAMIFDAPFFGTSLGDATPMTPPGTPVQAPELLSGMRDGAPVASVYARPGFDLPSGTYMFTAGTTTLTFTGVRAPTDDVLAQGLGFVVPQIQIVPTEPGCVVDCAISSIAYRWMERTADGWQPADPAELALLPDARVDLSRVWNGNPQVLHVTVPAAQQSGSLPWMASASHDGMLQSDLAGVSTSQLCYVRVSFQDLVGTRLTSSVGNAASACAGY